MTILPYFPVTVCYLSIFLADVFVQAFANVYFGWGIFFFLLLSFEDFYENEGGIHI